MSIKAVPLKDVNVRIMVPIHNLANRFNDINWTNLPTLLMQKFGTPLIAIVIFLLLWGSIASRIHTSLGEVPGPAKVWEQSMALIDEHYQERDKELAFYERQEKRNAKKL